VSLDKNGLLLLKNRGRWNTRDYEKFLLPTLNFIFVFSRRCYFQWCVLDEISGSSNVPQRFFHGGIPKIIFHISGNPAYGNFYTPESEEAVRSARWLLSSANCSTKIPAIFQGLFGTSRGISKFLMHFFPTISSENP